MKQFTSRTVSSLLAVLFLILGGLMLSTESHAQVQDTKAAITNPAPGGKAWVTNSQALQIVQSQIILLTSQLELLIQQGANEATIGNKKTELQYYITIQQLLLNGKHVSSAVYEALTLVGGNSAAADATEPHPFMAEADFNALLNKAINQFTS